MATELNDKQQRFAEEYVIDLNATQAAIRAGYDQNSAYSQGCRLLKHDKVKKYIDKLIDKRSERAQIDADWVLRKAAESHDRAVTNGDERAAQGALQLVGKHVNVQAFKERVEVTGDSELMERLARGRARVDAS